MKSKLKLLKASCLIALLSGCGQGNTTNSSHTNQNTPPKGPISYQKIQDSFNATIKSDQKSSASNSLQGGGSPCGGVLSDVSTDLVAYAGKFINLIPEVGPVLSTIDKTVSKALGIFGGSNSSSCLAQEFQSIENQLFVQQQQINQIEVSLNLYSNYLWNQIATLSSNIAHTNYSLFTNNLNTINGTDGVFENIYSAAGFYDSDSEQLTSQTLTQLEANPTNLAAAATAYNSIANTIEFP